MRLLAAPEYYEAHEALPWVALGWAGYGLFLVFVVIAGRAKVTVTQLPGGARRARRSTSCCSSLLVDPLGIAGAGIALGAVVRGDDGRARRC